MVQAYKATVAVAFFEIGPRLREYVSVDIDARYFYHARGYLAAGTSITALQLSQVRNSSLA